MTIANAFAKATRGEWVTSGLDVQYRIEYPTEDRAIVIFQWTNSKKDWLLNFDFAVVPYRASPAKWLVHRGFLKGYKSVRDEIYFKIRHCTHVSILGYSLGSAHASLLYEDLFFNNPEMKIDCMVFGTPRLVWMPSKEIRARFANIIRVNMKGDIVAGLPPVVFGYRHIGNLVELGDSVLFPSAKKHMEAAYTPAIASFETTMGAL